MMSCIRAKLEYLREHPELADKPGYELKKLRRNGDPYEWFLLLVKQPPFADHCNWEHLTGWQIRQILSKQPQFVDKCDLELLDDDAWNRLSWDQPQLAEMYRPKYLF